MASQLISPVRRTARRRAEERPGTRAQLLEAAGQVFAEKGVDRATGKEICERAGTNTAAINYYFGGMEGLYAAVIEEAQGRLISLDQLRSAIAGKTDAKAKLEAILGLAVDLLTGPISSSWVLRVIGREFMAPSSALESLIQRQGIPKLRIIRSIIAELMGLPEDDPAVARGCLMVIAPCNMLLLADRRTLKRVFPDIYLNRDHAAALARHMRDHALAGLAAVGREVRRESR